MAEAREVFTVDCIWVIFYICTPSKKISLNVIGYGVEGIRPE